MLRAFLLLLCLGVATSARAIKPPKLPKAGKGLKASVQAAKSAKSAAYQEELQHAAVLRQLNARKAQPSAPQVPTVAKPKPLTQQQKLDDLNQQIMALQQASLAKRQAAEYKHTPTAPTVERAISRARQQDSSHTQQPQQTDALKNQTPQQPRTPVDMPRTPAKQPEPVPEPAPGVKLTARQMAFFHAQRLREISARKEEEAANSPGAEPAPSPTNEPVAPQQPAQQLTDFDKRIMSLQQVRVAKVEEPVWLRHLANMPARKTPKMWLRLFEEYVLQYRKFPKNSGETALLYHAYLRLQKTLSKRSRILRRLRELRKQYPPEISGPKLPQTYADELDAFTAANQRLPNKNATDPAERALHKGVYNVLTRLGPQDPISQHIRHTLDQYPNSYKSPQVWADELEDFVAQNDRLPSYYSKDPAEKALYVGIQHVLQRLEPDDPLARRIRQMKAPYAVVSNSPQAWADELEDFVLRNNRLPSYYSQDPAEKALCKGIQNTLRRLAPDDPTVLRIRGLRRPYDAGPKRLLERLENFVTQYDRFPVPSIDGTENKLYWDVKKLLEQLPADDPVAIRIRRLRTQQLFYP